MSFSHRRLQRFFGEKSIIEIKDVNTIQLKIQIQQVSVTNGNNDSLSASGNCMFMFRNQGQLEVRPVAFKAYGQMAQELNYAGNGSVWVITGRLNVLKVSGQKNPQCLLTIEQGILTSTSGAGRTSPTTHLPQPQNPTSHLPPVPQPQPQVPTPPPLVNFQPHSQPGVPPVGVANGTFNGKGQSHRPQF